jgi:hypothetical protein
MSDSLEDPFSELLALCAAYRDRYGEWPTQVRLDARRLKRLCSELDESGVTKLAAHVRLGTRDSAGMSAGGRGVVQAAETNASAATLELARVWLADIDRGHQRVIGVDEDYWRNAAQRVLDAFPSERSLGLEHWLHAAQMGPIRLESEDPEDRRDELLFHVTYLASFGLEGIHPKTLAISRHSYGWQTAEDRAQLVLMLHRDDGRIALTDPPYDLLAAFPLARDRWPEAISELARRFADIAQGLAR